MVSTPYSTLRSTDFGADWFCGPSARRPDQSQDESQTNPNPSPVPLRSASAPMSPPQMKRSVSAPANPSLSPPQNLSTSPKRLAVPLSRSPLSRALSSQDSPSDSSSGSSPQSDIPHLSGSPPSLVLPLSASGTAPINIPGRNPNNDFSGYKVGTTPDVKLEMPEIIVPMEDRRTVGGEKCYLHLIKERLMGMYLSVYVYKGCEHLIQGESGFGSLANEPLMQVLRRGQGLCDCWSCRWPSRQQGWNVSLCVHRSVGVELTSAQRDQPQARRPPLPLCQFSPCSPYRPGQRPSRQHCQDQVGPQARHILTERRSTTRARRPHRPL